MRVDDHVAIPGITGDLRKAADVPSPDGPGNGTGLHVVDEVLLPCWAPPGALAVEGADHPGVRVQVPDLENAAVNTERFRKVQSSISVVTVSY